MIIECPSCHARAKLPESKEGAKVRCAECDRIYVARSSTSGAASSRRQSSAALPIGIGAGVVALVMILIMVKSRGTGPVVEPTEPPPPPPPVVTDETGWDSELVVFTRKLHDAAYGRDSFKVQGALSFAHVWARLQSTDEETIDPSAWDGVTPTEVSAFRKEVVDSLLADEPGNLVGSWQPYDGSLIAEDDESAIVHLKLQPRTAAAGSGDRNIEWKLVKSSGEWLAWSWERWFSEAEKKADRVAKKKKIERKTLSDGSEVIEAEPGPIPYMDETPVAERERIDTLIEELIDLEQPAREMRRIKTELRLAGKTAIPGLLTKFYEMNLAGFPDLDSAIQAQLIDEMLGDITEYPTTFKAHEALGATKERRDSGVRQWFGWYWRKFKNFEGPKEGVDLLDEMIELKTEAERREYEKQKRIIEQEEKDRKAREEREKEKQNDG